MIFPRIYPALLFKQISSIFVSGFIFCSLAGCNRIPDGIYHSSTTGHTTYSTTTAPDSLAAQADPSGIKNTSATTFYNCARGFPNPIINRILHPETIFQVQKDSTIATESVVLRNEDRLTIKHWGCEYFLLTFRFETSRFKGDVHDTKYWFDKVIILLSETKDALVEQPGTTNLVMNGIQALHTYTAATAQPAFKEEIDFGNGEIRNFVIFDSVQQIDKQKYAIEVTTAVGPL